MTEYINYSEYEIRDIDPLKEIQDKVNELRGEVKGLLDGYELLCQVMATLKLERNKNTAKEQPKEFIKGLYEIIDTTWTRRFERIRKDIEHDK